MLFYSSGYLKSLAGCVINVAIVVHNEKSKRSASYFRVVLFS